MRPQLRLAFRRFFENTFAELAVLSYAEIPARMQVQNAAVIPSWNKPSHTMKTYRLVASNPASALEKVHRQLGPSAVVLSMRQLPGQGLARLWHKSVEIVAGLPNAIPFSQPPPKSFPGTRRPARLLCPEPLLRWPTVAWLESMGLLSAHAEALQAQ